MLSIPLFIYTETSLHAGVGSTVSAIDLPIQRERTTQFPIVQGSGIKGALRSQAKQGESVLKAVFGDIYEVEEVDENGKKQKKQVSFAGAVSVGDARIVLFPVRSLSGVFAYATCAAVLARVARDVEGFPSLSSSVVGENALVTSGSALSVTGRAVLEEFSFECTSDKSVDAIAKWLAENAFPTDQAYEYWRKKVQNSLIVLSDESFRDFVQNSTEIVTRVRLERVKKTVAQGALWTQEALPSDCLLMSAILARSTRDGSNGSDEEVANWLRDAENVPQRIQLGGDETTGSGMVALRWAGA
ncbi:MAG: type III-B CRISPR module RAMP protein Cmr4 [Chloroflexi bacterium CFX4]|nr:type III-B CRISPR module RAMP protein Cmr4 [Chloroflexi bacterium CFX4]MDL1924115.1 type III-B CRISPR module RAMP protein Cmr4 [Chloroflexi bacterium CFX3]